MARAVEFIERDLAALQEALNGLTEEFRKTYKLYLTSLGQAVRQQLILASYHLCTQGYPQSFLNLSFSQRQQLQQTLRQMAQKTAEQLLQIGEQHLGNSPLPDDQVSENEESNQQSQFPTLNKDGPDYLAKWQENSEQAIAQTIANLSRDANRLLQQAGILSNKLPEAILEVAGKAEAAGEMMAGPPNLLNLLIEAENPENSDSSSMTHIIAINLRSSEIEFADSASMAGRNQIRSLLSRLSALRRDYHKKQRERTIANAEGAWRSSWFED